MLLSWLERNAVSDDFLEEDISNKEQY